MHPARHAAPAHRVAVDACNCHCRAIGPGGNGDGALKGDRRPGPAICCRWRPAIGSFGFGATKLCRPTGGSPQGSSPWWREQVFSGWLAVQTALVFVA
jgi:hypothetical protein